MHDAITDVEGLEVGHSEDREALTGCTVLLCRSGAVVGVDVRGLAPGTRETDLCRPGTLIERAHAILLSGGSAFGLNAASGVMRFLWERGIGFDTGVARVPIVPGAVIFDLAVGGIAWPDDAMGYDACRHARSGEVAQGCVGVGTGASVGKLLGRGQATKSGIGTASVRMGGAIVGALVVVNAMGNVVSPRGAVIVAGARDPLTGAYVDATEALSGGSPATTSGTHTTIGVVATNAGLTPEEVNHLATIAHDGLARTIRPAHTLFDGDTIFALATGEAGERRPDAIVGLAVATVEAVERAVLKAVELAAPAGGLPSSSSREIVHD